MGTEITDDLIRQAWEHPFDPNVRKLAIADSAAKVALLMDPLDPEFSRLTEGRMRAVLEVIEECFNRGYELGCATNY